MDIATITNSTLLAIDIETTGLTRDDEIFSAAIAWETSSSEIKTESFLLDRYHKSYRVEEDGRFKDFLGATLFSNSYQGIVLFHNMNFDLLFLLKRYYKRKYASTKLCKIIDTMTLSRLSKNNKFKSHSDPLNRSGHSLKFLIDEFLGKTHQSFEEVTGGMNIRLAPTEQVLAYNKLDSKYTIEIYYALKKLLSVDEWRYAMEVEIPHSYNIFHLNYNGVPYNKKAAQELMNKLYAFTKELEVKIYAVNGRAFNISSQMDLNRAVFYNTKIKIFNKDSEADVLRPLYETDKGQVKVDVDTLMELEKRIITDEKILDSDKISNNKRIIAYLNYIIQYLESYKAISNIENLDYYSIREDNWWKIYPKVTADALSGRSKCSSPNLLGMSKVIYKKSHKVGIPEDLARASVRNLIMTSNENLSISSIDFKGLDLGIVAHGATEFNPDFYWLKFFDRYGSENETIDNHFAILQKVDEELYLAAFKGVSDNLEGNILDYWALKPENDRVKLIHKETHEYKIIFYADGDNGPTYKELKRVRKIVKELNLSIGYIIGAVKLAIKLKEAKGDLVSADEAQTQIDNFMEAFPEIRKFQDKIANHAYKFGYVQSDDGRKSYMECWDDLNDYYLQNENEGRGTYEFICRINNKYWYVKATTWLKDQSDIIKNLKVLGGPFLFKFGKIVTIRNLSSDIFKKSDKKKSKFNRKSDDNIAEESDFMLTRIQMTCDIDKDVSGDNHLSQEALGILGDMIEDGTYLLPEKWVLFYRVRLRNPSSRYFKIHHKLARSVRKFFPMYCQGIATSEAKKALTKVREKIEEGNLDAKILFFVHDQFDVEVSDEIVDKMKVILTEAVESNKGLRVSFSGDYENKGRDFSSKKD